MADQRSLNLFSVFSLTPAYWDAEGAAQARLTQDLTRSVTRAADRVQAYRLFPTRSDADFLLWTAVHVDAPERAGAFLADFAQAVAPYRRYLQPVNSLWGFTRPSVYAGGRSAQEIDPFGDSRKPYLVIYPFAKTTDWYLMSRDARQGMMNEHIRQGREFPDILQLLLYSTGLQDQEFVVAYETDDLARFSELVVALRDTEARRYTSKDTPIYTAIYAPLDDVLSVPER